MMQKQIQSTGKRGFFLKKSVGPQVREKFTFEDMLCFQKVKHYAVFHENLFSCVCQTLENLT